MPVPEGFYTVPDMGKFGAPRPATGRRHAGLDQYAPEGTATGLEQRATILAKGSNLDPATGYGHWVRYRHDDGHELLEAHLMAPSPLQVGRTYPEDTLIGRVGDTGNAVRVGPHVHVEVRTPKGLLTDPARYLASIQPDQPPPVAPTRRSKGVTLFYCTKTDKPTAPGATQPIEAWGMGGDSPGTSANWQTTTDPVTSRAWAAQHGATGNNWVFLTRAQFEQKGRSYLEPLRLEITCGKNGEA